MKGARAHLLDTTSSKASAHVMFCSYGLSVCRYTEGGRTAALRCNTLLTQTFCVQIHRGRAYSAFEMGLWLQWTSMSRQVNSFLLFFPVCGMQPHNCRPHCRRENVAVMCLGFISELDA